MKPYTPLDYTTWILGGKGKNIQTWASHAHLQLWNAALPFQDQRDDPGQGEFVTHFAHTLLSYEAGDAQIVIPAAILHDIGWDVPPAVFRVALHDPAQMHALRMRHQIVGIQRARKILEEVDYPREHWGEILAIIGDHDTRFATLSNNERIMRDADILWRFTMPHYTAYLQEKNPLQVRAHMEEEYALPQRFYFASSRMIARTELENTLQWIDAQQ